MVANKATIKSDIEAQCKYHPTAALMKSTRITAELMEAVRFFWSECVSGFEFRYRAAARSSSSCSRARDEPRQFFTAPRGKGGCPSQNEGTEKGGERKLYRNYFRFTSTSATEVVCSVTFFSYSAIFNFEAES